MARTRPFRPRWLMLAGALLVLAPAANAQKVAFVASEEILKRLSEVRDARARLAELQANWMRDIQRQEAEITQLKAQMEANRLLWSAQERRDAESRLKDLEARLAAFRASRYDAGGEYEKAHQELMAPLLRKVFDAIAEEAKSQKVDFVFDKSSRGMPMLFANAEYDLTAAVLERLGVKVDPAEISPPDTTGMPEGAPEGGSPRRGRRDETSPTPPPPGDPNDILNGKGDESR